MNTYTNIHRQIHTQITTDETYIYIVVDVFLRNTVIRMGIYKGIEMLLIVDSERGELMVTTTVNHPR